MNFRLEGRVIFFATSNIHKFQEARVVLNRFKITVGMLRIKTSEIQSESLVEIATSSVQDAYCRCHLPIIVEDAGLFVDELKGFPGPYAAYVFITLGNGGLLRLMEGEENRRARFQSVVAFLSVDLKSPVCFEGETFGELVSEERTGNGISGFGFDPIFKPSTANKTFAEMSMTEKNEHSHRASALEKFARWYKKYSC